MSEEDFGTMNVGRSDRVRDIEMLRRRYRQHREVLARLAADAPSPQLSAEYQRMIGIVDESLRRVDELEALPVAAPKIPPAQPAVATEPAMPIPPRHPARSSNEPPTLVDHELDTTPGYDDETAIQNPGGSSSKMLIGIAVLIAMIALIGWLIWRSGEKKADPVVDDTTQVVEPAQPDTETGTVVETETPASTAAPAAGVAITPPAHDYGTIAKGTRAARQFEIANRSDKAITVQLARSQCRCLYYEYSSRIEAGGRETVTVTVDGAKAQAGTLDESIAVTSKGDPSIKSALRVVAKIE